MQLVTFNVVNLYTNFEYMIYLNYLKWHEKHPEILKRRLNNEFVLEYEGFILQSDNAKMDNEFYNQIKGTEMEVIFASNYATFSMGNFWYQNS